MGTAAVSTASVRKTGWLRGIRGAERFAWGVAGYNVLVILWGALVRATGSGAGCGNHWPLCNGVVIPVSPSLHTIIEFTHRAMVSGSVYAMIALLVWTFRATVKGQAARVFVLVSTALLVNEAFLGALLVKLGYVTGNQSLGRVIVLSVHLSNTLLLLAALTMTAWMLRTRQPWRELRAKGTDAAIAVVQDWRPRWWSGSADRWLRWAIRSSLLHPCGPPLRLTSTPLPRGCCGCAACIPRARCWPRRSFSGWWFERGVPAVRPL